MLYSILSKNWILTIMLLIISLLSFSDRDCNPSGSLIQSSTLAPGLGNGRTILAAILMFVMVVYSWYVRYTTSYPMPWWNQPVRRLGSHWILSNLPLIKGQFYHCYLMPETFCSVPVMMSKLDATGSTWNSIIITKLWYVTC